MILDTTHHARPRSHARQPDLVEKPASETRTRNPRLAANRPSKPTMDPPSISTTTTTTTVSPTTAATTTTLPTGRGADGLTLSPAMAATAAEDRGGRGWLRGEEGRTKRSRCYILPLLGSERKFPHSDRLTFGTLRENLLLGRSRGNLRLLFWLQLMVDRRPHYPMTKSSLKQYCFCGATGARQVLPPLNYVLNSRFLCPLFHRAFLFAISCDPGRYQSW